MFLIQAFQKEPLWMKSQIVLKKDLMVAEVMHSLPNNIHNLFFKKLCASQG